MTNQEEAYPTSLHSSIHPPTVSAAGSLKPAEIDFSFVDASNEPKFVVGSIPTRPTKQPPSKNIKAMFLEKAFKTPSLASKRSEDTFSHEQVAELLKEVEARLLAKMDAMNRAHEAEVAVLKEEIRNLKFFKPAPPPVVTPKPNTPSPTTAPKGALSYSTIATQHRPENKDGWITAGAPKKAAAPVAQKRPVEKVDVVRYIQGGQLRQNRLTAVYTQGWERADCKEVRKGIADLADLPKTVIRNVTFFEKDVTQLMVFEEHAEAIKKAIRTAKSSTFFPSVAEVASLCQDFSKVSQAAIRRLPTQMHALRKAIAAQERLVMELRAPSSTMAVDTTATENAQVSH